MTLALTATSAFRMQPIQAATRTPGIAAPLTIALAPDPGEAPGPVVLCLPAMGVPAAFYRRFASTLAELLEGPVALGEFPGQGTSPLRVRRGADFGYREIVEECIPAYVDQLRAAYPGRPLYLVGHSLGAQLAVLALARLQQRVDGLALVAAGTAHYEAWGADRVDRARRTVRTVQWAARLLPWYPGSWIGFGGDQPRRLMRDWSLNATTGRYAIEGDPLGDGQRQALLDQQRLPVLAVGIEGDAVAPPAATNALLAFLPAARVRREVVPGTPGDTPWRRHFSWARAPHAVCMQLAAWIAQLDAR